MSLTSCLVSMTRNATNGEGTDQEREKMTQRYAVNFDAKWRKWTHWRSSDYHCGNLYQPNTEHSFTISLCLFSLSSYLCLPIWMALNWSVFCHCMCLFFCLSIHLSVCLSMYLFVTLYLCLSFNLSLMYLCLPSSRSCSLWSKVSSCKASIGVVMLAEILWLKRGTFTITISN